MARKPKPVPVPLSLWERCKQITVLQAIAFVMGAASTLAPAYVAVKSIAARAADTYVQQQLKKNGLDPKAVGQALKDIEQQKVEGAKIQSDLATVKAQNRAQQELLEKVLQQLIKDQP